MKDLQVIYNNVISYSAAAFTKSALWKSGTQTALSTGDGLIFEVKASSVTEAYFNEFPIYQSINQTSIAPISLAKPGSVARQPNQCSRAKSRKQFRNMNRQSGMPISMGERPSQRDLAGFDIKLYSSPQFERLLQNACKMLSVKSSDLRWEGQFCSEP